MCEAEKIELEVNKKIEARKNSFYHCTTFHRTTFVTDSSILGLASCFLQSKGTWNVACHKQSLGLFSSLD